MRARKTLLSALSSFAGRRQPERDAIAAVPPKTDTSENLSKSIGGLADLGDSWLALEDETSVILAEDARLTKELQEWPRGPQE